MKTYPEIYEHEAMIVFVGDDIKRISTALLDAVTKLARPRHSKERAFFTEYDWRIRLEVHPDHMDPDVFSYVLDVGQGFGQGQSHNHCALEDFKADCEASGSSIIVPYCDNILPPTERQFVQDSGTLRVYAMTKGSIHESARQRWVTELASAYIEAINSLNEHFVVVDATAIRL